MTVQLRQCQPLLRQLVLLQQLAAPAAARAQNHPPQRLSPVLVGLAMLAQKHGQAVLAGLGPLLRRCENACSAWLGPSVSQLLLLADAMPDDAAAWSSVSEAA